MSLISLIWKIPVAIVALIVGALAAGQAGWSGAELVMNAPIMGPIENFVTSLFFAISAGLTAATVALLYRITKYLLLLAVPLFLYCTLVPGVWNGFLSDFDATREQAIKHGYANAFAIEHMSARGRYQTCNDREIELTDDAREACTRLLKADPGEIIPGSEHRCGLLGMFSCIYTAPDKGD